MDDSKSVENRWPFADRVSILGVRYEIRQRTEKEEPRLEGLSGFMDHTSHLIVIRSDAEGNLDDLAVSFARTLRHEIVHAFLVESGLYSNTFSVESWADNEEMVDWIAWQGPKIVKAWVEARCL